jgi:hypothetical protein
MGIKAKQYSERFSSERMLKEMEFVYRKLLINVSSEKIVSKALYGEESSKVE